MSRKPYKRTYSEDGILALFFDFYVMNEIWFKTVGMADYGYPLTKILPNAKESAIRETFENRVAKLKAEVIRALEYSVRREIRHFHWQTESHRDYWTGNVKKNCPKGIFMKRHRIRGNTSLVKRPLSTISEAFHIKAWSADYGGKRWGTATDFLIKLKESKSLKDDIFLLDRIFDLQHNTGHILNKTTFRCLSKSRRFRNAKNRPVQPLNFRFKATIKDMADKASAYVRGLYTANLAYI